MLTIKDCRPEVQAFAVLMEQQLRRHDAKKGTGGWRDDDPRDLTRHLYSEVNELSQEVNAAVAIGFRDAERWETGHGTVSRRGNNGQLQVADGTYALDSTPERITRIGEEAAAAANMAMMVADRCGAISSPLQSTDTE
ncbi:MAG TPA: hypothetical protein VLL76_03650 [Candidatus Omnitrophota bacterium]|nr:hypothetical protein [Candidatus Omnitrophota bacterium]